ncbi:MAG: hypothetical protein WBA66_12445 [Xanthobacteraceae bacterium]
MDTVRHTDHRAALLALETAAATARAGFACNFSSAAEYEQALIAARRAEGRYRAVNGLPRLLFACGAVAVMVVGLWSLLTR